MEEREKLFLHRSKGLIARLASILYILLHIIGCKLAVVKFISFILYAFFIHTSFT